VSIKAMFLIMLLLFVIGILLGFFATLAFQSLGEIGFVKELTKQIYGGAPTKFYSFDTALYIFGRNMLVALISIALGIAVFVPGLIVFANGFVVGLIAFFVTSLMQSPIVSIAAIAPHGIIEIPAILLATGFGTKIGVEFWRYIVRRSKDELLRTLRKAPMIIAIVALMLFAASIVETFVTPYIVSKILGVTITSQG